MAIASGRAGLVLAHYKGELSSKMAARHCANFTDKKVTLHLDFQPFLFTRWPFLTATKAMLPAARARS